MTDDELINAFATTPAPMSFGDLDAWRRYRDRMHELLDVLDARMRAADEAELAAVQARMSALQSRLGVTSPVSPPMPASLVGTIHNSQPTSAKPRREIDADGIVAAPSYAETDAGRGVGGGRERPQTVDEFQLDLSQLRDRTVEKRARGGLV